MTESVDWRRSFHRSATVARSQAASAAGADPDRSDGTARPSASRAGSSHWLTGDERRHDRPDAARCQRTPQTRSDASQITINASRVASLYKRRAGRGPNRRLACPARSRRIACLRCKPLTAANSSRIRPRSFRLPEAYRPASAATSSSRVVMLIHPISAPADDARWGANQMRQRVSPREHLRRGNAPSAAPAG